MGGSTGGGEGASSTVVAMAVLIVGVESTVRFSRREAEVASLIWSASLVATASFSAALSVETVTVRATLAASATTTTWETGTNASDANADATWALAASPKVSIEPATCVLMVVW